MPKYRIYVGLQQHYYDVNAVDDLDAEQQVNRIMLDGEDVWEFLDIEIMEEDNG